MNPPFSKRPREDMENDYLTLRGSDCSESITGGTPRHDWRKWESRFRFASISRSPYTIRQGGERRGFATLIAPFAFSRGFSHLAFSSFLIGLARLAIAVLTLNWIHTQRTGATRQIARRLKNSWIVKVIPSPRRYSASFSSAQLLYCATYLHRSTAFPHNSRYLIYRHFRISRFHLLRTRHTFGGLNLPRFVDSDDPKIFRG